MYWELGELTTPADVETLMQRGREQYPDERPFQPVCNNSIMIAIQEAEKLANPGGRSSCCADDVAQNVAMKCLILQERGSIELAGMPANELEA